MTEHSDTGDVLEGAKPGGAPTHDRVRLWRGADRVAIAVTFALVALSRIGYHLAGVRWDGSLLRHAWQLLDLRLLEDDLLRSVWYLHIQPPLFNLFVGLVLKISPFDDQATLAWVWQGFGLVLCLLLYDIARHLRFTPRGAAALTVVIGAGPGVVLYERWFQYEMPVMVLLCGTVAGFLRWTASGSTKALWATTGCAAAVVLTRSLVHPVWLLGVVALALLARPRRLAPAAQHPHRKPKILAATLVPLLLVAGVMVKNHVLFGTSDLSSWLGWNLHRIALTAVPQDERPALVEEGVLSTISARYINQPIEFYDGVLGPCEPSRPGVRALAEARKSPNPMYPDQPPDNNLNHECYLRVYEAFQQDSLAYIREHPREYLHNVAGAAHLWALPTSDYVFLRANADAVGVVESFYRRIVLLTVTAGPFVTHPSVEAQLLCIELPDGALVCSIPGGEYRFSLSIVLGTLGVALMAVRALWRWARFGERQQAVWLLLAGTIGWVTFASVALEIGENHRFRSIVEPLTLLVVVMVLRGTATRVRARFM